LAIGRDIERSIAVKQFKDVIGWWCGDDRGGDELVHCFVVLGMGGVVNDAGAAGVNCTREEGESYVTVVGDALEGADEVGPFEVLRLVSCGGRRKGVESLPLTRASIDLSTHLGRRYRQKD